MNKMNRNAGSYIILADDEHYCKYCKKIYENVHQTECGCRYCFECLKDVKRIYQNKCIICKETIDLNAIIKDRAFQKTIEKLRIKCNACSWCGKKDDFDEHYQSHEDLCIFSKIGCKTNFSESTTRAEHSESDVPQHLRLLYKDIDSKLSKLEKVNIDQVKSDKTSAIETPLKDDEFKKRVKNFEQNVQNFKNYFTEIDLNNKKHESALDVLESNQKNIIEELGQVEKQLLPIQSASIAINERLSLMEKGSFDGKLIWKITEVKEKSQSAISGRQKYINSVPFYTSIYGYKLCCRIYLNGDGDGLNTHLSLFLVIMKGEYDELLKWPFKQKTTFILMDQQLNNEKNENIIETFKPTQNLPSFMKPKTEMNVPSGIPLFCSLNKLYSSDHEYIKQDCMFMKIIVDSKDEFI